MPKKRFNLGKSLGALFRALKKRIHPRRYKLGKSIGAPFRVLKKIIRGGAPQPEPTVIYVPFSLTIKVKPLRIYSHGRILHQKSDKEAKKMNLLLALNDLELIDEITDD